jgi:hypothetical protein
LDDVLRRHPKANGLFDDLAECVTPASARSAGPLDAACFFSVTKQKTLEPIAIREIPFPAGNARMAPMTASLLDECYESILKIAETQAPVGKMAISTMAEMFRENSGREVRDGRPSSSQEFQAPDRQPIPFRGRSTTRHALKG